MWKQEEFKAKVDALKQEIKIPDDEPFNNGSLADFCEDIELAINGMNPSFQNSFKSFYKKVVCTISGDQIQTVTFDGNNNCPHLYQYLNGIEIPTTIQIAFTLEEPRLPGWAPVTEAFKVYFNIYQFELHYEYGPQLELRYPKSYRTTILRVEVMPLLEEISSSFFRRIAAKAEAL
ncbi:MAG: hypothetical protein QM768_12180 [Agriterribacter sp.]